MGSLVSSYEKCFRKVFFSHPTFRLHNLRNPSELSISPPALYIATLADILETSDSGVAAMVT